MAQIGNWGSALKFAVNSNKQLPFTDFKRSIKARWATHNINQAKPRTEYQGIDQPSVTFNVTFSVQRGQKPRKCIDRLEQAVRLGELQYLYIGGKRIGGNKYYIESINSNWKEVWNKGELVRASADITMKEYN